MPAYTNDLDGFITWEHEAALAFAGDLRGIHYTKAVPPQKCRVRGRHGRSDHRKVRPGDGSATSEAPTAKLTRLEVITAPIRRDGRMAYRIPARLRWSLIEGGLHATSRTTWGVSAST